MIVNEVVTGLIVVIIAYLLGSINSAYIVTRLVKRQDIRTLGGGNAGGRNVYRSVGFMAAVPVAIFDIGKGVASIAIAHWLLDVPLYQPHIFVFCAGIAAVVGHMWSVYLKFTGGNGLAAAIGVLAMTLPWALLIVLGFMFIISLITRNPVLSLNIGLLSLPVSSWFFEKDWLPVVFTIILIIIMVLNFIPTARKALSQAGSAKNLQTELLRQDKE
ncbi:glycerol-3-phosphate acyltransferase [Chloroflexota bacterium]